MGGKESKFADDKVDGWHPKKRRDSESSVFKKLNSQQIQNQSGAYVWVVDDFMLLQRFIFLGTDNSFSAVDKEPKRKHAECIDRLIAAGKGKDVVELISDISHSGRAPRHNLIIFALAICARCNDLETKKLAYGALGEICRIPTHLFMFVNYCKHESGNSKGWGRAHRNAIINWYLEKCKNPVGVGRLLTKYKRRKMKNGEKQIDIWTHRDVLLLSHPKPKTDVMKVMLRFVMKGFEAAKHLAVEEMGNNEKITEFISYLEATEKAKKCTDEEEMVQMIQLHKLEREHLPTQMMHSKKVWEALVMNMKMEAKIRNLGTISAKGLCGEGSWVEKEIVKTLTDQQALRGARTHPFKVLLAMLTYEKGSGEFKRRSKNGNIIFQKREWEVNKNIISALDQAFCFSFSSVQPTGKRYLLAMNVSDSMKVPCVGSHAITCHQAAAAMIMVTVRTEAKCKVVAFSHQLTRVDIDKTDTLSQVLKKTENIPEGNTDCALPMLWAKENKQKYNVFIVYTDSEPCCGQIHPSIALQEYRDKMKIPDAKLIVVGMASNGFTIADPDDRGMLDIVGFDSMATILIAKFSHGRI